MPYCELPDLLLGNLPPLPSTVDPASYVQDAADEIDSMIGFRYTTPVVDWADADPQPEKEYTLARPVVLLLKRLNVFLATGRLILAIDAAGEDRALHAYGLKLVNDALATLTMIREGRLDLVGAPEIDPVTADSVPGPRIINGDASSAVDDFYGSNGPMSANPITGSRVNGPYGFPSDVERYPLAGRGF